MRRLYCWKFAALCNVRPSIKWLTEITVCVCPGKLALPAAVVAPNYISCWLNESYVSIAATVTALWELAAKRQLYSRTDCSERTILSYLLIYSMEQSPSWEAIRFSASQEIPHILWNLKVTLPHSQVPATCPYPEPDRSSPCPPTSHFLKIHLNIILPSMPGSPKWCLSFRFPHQNPVYTSSPYALRAPPISLFSIWSSEKYWVMSTDH